MTSSEDEAAGKPADASAAERRERRTQVDLTWPAQAERRNAARGRRASDEEFWNSLPASVRESLAAKADRTAAAGAAPTTPELVELDARIITLRAALERVWHQTTDSGVDDFEADQAAHLVISQLATELETVLAQRVDAQQRARES